MQFLAQSLQQVCGRMRAAEQQYGRETGSVRLLAVSKTRSADAIREIVGLGVEDIAENYQQEAADKQLRLDDCNITWHFIGPVQSNKCAYISRHFHWVHSVGRGKTARRLSTHRPAELPPMNICLQVNISAEDSKSGVRPQELDALAEQVAAMPGLRLRGLMALPAPGTGFEAQRQAFSEVRRLYDQLCAGGLSLDTLSMGTTQDMEAAIAEGATMIRIGTALFGPRS